MNTLSFYQKWGLNKPKFLGIYLSIVYLVGIVGILLPIHEDFILLTPLNLLFSLFIVLLVHPTWDKQIIIALMVAYSTGFGVELAGVQSGIIFGEYQYGATLGPKILGTPFMIGVNWVMLVYASSAIVNRHFAKIPLVLKAAIGASLMVFLDLFIEPVAIQQDFWSWGEAGYNSFIVAPLQNYIVWWIVAFGLVLFTLISTRSFHNKIAELLYLLQLVFFIILNLFL
ncbi:MAG: carotenoid biosynthesis protein [Saprospiraceae bacterium]|nr:carotenoid biosynthesis protein [Saprospiraceae bacterium]